MTKIDVDTAKLKDCGKDILSASTDFNSNISSLFERMYNVPITTKEWIGKSSKIYASNVLKEKSNYDNYGTELKKLGQSLIDYADDLEMTVRNTKISRE